MLMVAKFVFGNEFLGFLEKILNTSDLPFPCFSGPDRIQLCQLVSTTGCQRLQGEATQEAVPRLPGSAPPHRGQQPNPGARITRAGAALGMLSGLAGVAA